MKFAPSRLYIESYDKCPNCGILIYEKPANESVEPVLSEGKTYCTPWCVAWERERAARHGADAEA